METQLESSAKSDAWTFPTITVCPIIDYCIKVFKFTSINNGWRGFGYNKASTTFIHLKFHIIYWMCFITSFPESLSLC